MLVTILFNFQKPPLHHAGLLRWVRIFKHTYTNPFSNCMATCGLRGPLSAVIGPCVDSYYCCIIPVWRIRHSRWNAWMGPKMGGQLDDPPESQEGESRLQRTTFGGATPLTKPVKNTLKTAVGTVGPHRADLHWWVRIPAHIYTTLLVASTAFRDSGWWRYSPAKQAP